jgi:predicted ATPase
VVPEPPHEIPIQELPADAARLRLYGCLAETLEALASEQPLLLGLDDLQWADELTLGFLGLLQRSGRLQQAPWLLLGTYRSEEPAEALEALVAGPGVWSLELGRLDEAAVGSMLADMLALQRSPQHFARYLVRHSATG